MKIACRLLLVLCVVSAPLCADPPKDKPLPGERIGGYGQDLRAIKRIDNRVPSRLDTRIQPRTIGKPLMAATSPIISDAKNGCARDASQSAASMAQSAQSCEGPQ